MKKLYLLRHAKADYPQGIADHDRPINARGKEACKMMGKFLIDNNITPELVLCSDANRTEMTAKALFQLQPGVNITLSKKLYQATPGEILKEIAKVNDNINSLMIVAHNPGVPQLALLLADKNNLALLQEIKIKYSTCALTEFTFNVKSWSEVEPQEGMLERYVRPRDLV